MKVVAKYKRVEISFHHECVSLNFSSVKDALTFTDWYKKAAQIRIRACTDVSYPKEFYNYLKERGIINADLFESRQRMMQKYNLLASLTPKWL